MSERKKLQFGRPVTKEFLEEFKKYYMRDEEKNQYFLNLILAGMDEEFAGVVVVDGEINMFGVDPAKKKEIISTVEKRKKKIGHFMMENF